MSLLQKVYDLEVNFKIETYWDAGFDWVLFDGEFNVETSGTAATFAEAEQAVYHAAMDYTGHKGEVV